MKTPGAETTGRDRSDVRSTRQGVLSNRDSAALQGWQKTPGFRLKATSPDKSQAFDAHHRKLAETSSGTLPKSQTMVLGGASAFSFRFPFSSFELVANRGNRNDEFRPLGFDLEFLS